MNQQGPPPEQPWIAYSVALYQRLVVLYPPAFRRAYEAHLVQTFRDMCRQAVFVRGLPGLFGCWMSMLTDLASNALAERFTEGFSMSRAMLIRLAGGLTLVSVVLLLPLLLSTRTPLFTVGPVFFPSPSGGNGPEVSFELFSRPSVAFPLVAKLLAACCFALGLLGVTLTQRRWIGRLAGGLALLGQIGLVLYLLLLLWFESAPFQSEVMGVLSPDLMVLRLWSDLLPLGASLALGLGLIGCGLVTLKTGRFTPWSAALLVLGLWLGVGNLGLWWLEWTNPSLYLEAAISMVWTSFFSLYALISYLLWGWLGFTLWMRKPSQAAQIQAALG
jgi:hypothetical protein